MWMPSVCRLAVLVPLLLSAASCGGDATSGALAAAPGATEPGTVTVRPRDFVRRLRVTGLTEATRSYVVTTPLLTGSTRGSLVLTKLAPAGTAVKPGDLLVQFDSQAQDKVALDKRAEYQDLVQQITQKSAEQSAARVKDESELAQARNAVKNFELEILKNEMLSRVLAEKNDQDLAEARSKLAALQDGFALKRTAAAAELRILEIRRDRAKSDMDHAVENSVGMTVHSPLDGLIVPKLTWRGNGPADIQEGDEMWPGSPVLQVVNQASMQVRARVNQADLALVRPGLPVTVRLDAYPDFQMPGQIVQLAPIGVPGSFSTRVRVFNAVVTINGASPRLLPDLTAAIDVEVERTKNALVVPWSAVQRDTSGAHVRVRAGNGVVARPVTLGPGDEIDVVVTSGLQSGEVVLK
jgi:HlyD family secretion protein